MAVMSSARRAIVGSQAKGANLNWRACDAARVSGAAESVLATEAAIQIGLLIEAAGYAVDATPRPNGADLAAERDGTVWATFHLDVDRDRPWLLRLGATVWGGARVGASDRLDASGRPNEALAEFVRERMDLACRKGREQNPEHCQACPVAAHRR